MLLLSTHQSKRAEADFSGWCQSTVDTERGVMNSCQLAAGEKKWQMHVTARCRNQGCS